MPTCLPSPFFADPEAAVVTGAAAAGAGTAAAAAETAVTSAAAGRTAVGTTARAAAEAAVRMGLADTNLAGGRSPLNLLRLCSPPMIHSHTCVPRRLLTLLMVSSHRPHHVLFMLSICHSNPAASLQSMMQRLSTTACWPTTGLFAG